MKAFLSGVVLAIVLSYMFPEVGIKGGIVHSELFIKKIGVGIIFFCSGMKLDPDQIRSAGLNWKAHLFCQLYTFVFTPLVVYTVISAVQPLLEESLADSAFVFDAVKTLACLPPPVSSAVILTAIAKGDEAVAIFNSSVGSFVGIFVTPILVTLLVTNPAQEVEFQEQLANDPAYAHYKQEMAQRGVDIGAVETAGNEISASEMAFELSLSVLAPLLVGQMVKKVLGLGKPPSWIGNLVLVLIIWASFCELWVSDISVTVQGLAFIVVCVVSIQLFGLTLVWFTTTKVLKFDSGATTALLFACTHKSLTLGMPLIDVLFPATASATSIPILMCHPLQILGGGFIAGNLSKSEYMGPSSPRSAAYQAVHDATELEMVSSLESGSGSSEEDEVSSFDAADDEFDGTEVGNLFPHNDASGTTCLTHRVCLSARVNVYHALVLNR